MADWKMIRQEYLETGLSMDQLAEKHGVNRNTLRYHARNEKWSARREKVRRLADRLSIEAAAQHRAEMGVLLDQIGMQVCENLLSILAAHRETGYTRLEQTGPEGSVVFDLLDLVKTLQKLAAVYGLDAASEMERERLEIGRQYGARVALEPGAAVIVDSRPID